MMVGQFRPDPMATSASDCSVATTQPLLARTDPPSLDAICQAYSSRLAMRLAMRSGSSAAANAIIEKFGTRTKANRSGPRPTASGRPDDFLPATTRFMAAARILVTIDVANSIFACQHRDESKRTQHVARLPSS